MTTRLAAIQGRTACVTSLSVYFRVLTPAGVVPFSLSSEIPPFLCSLFCLPLLPPLPVGTALPRPARSRGPASLRTHLRGTSFPGRLFPGRRWPRGAGLEPLQPPEAARALPARWRPWLFPASLGQASSGKWRGKCGDRDGNSIWGFPRRRERSSRRPGAGSPHARRECRAGPPFRRPGAQLVVRISAPPRAARPTPRTRRGWLRAVRRNTPSLASNQGGGHPSSTVRR